MNIIKKYLLILLLISVSAFTRCGDSTGGSQAGGPNGLSSDFYIKSLTFSEGTLRYPFNSGDWINYLEVPFTAGSITVTAETNHNWAEIYIGDEKLVNNIESGPISLVIGENIIRLRVIAENSEELVYTIYTTRCSENYSVAALSALTIDGISLTPVFSAESSAREYSAMTTSSTVSLQATASAESEGATVEISVNSQAVSDPTAISLNQGVNTIMVISTAPDGKTEERYTITIIRQSEANDSSMLAILSIAGGNLSPSFDPDTTDYTIDVTSTMNPVNLTAVAESDRASVAVTVNGTAAADMTSIAIPQGVVSTLRIIVTAGNSSSTTYTILANSLQGSDNASLSGIKVTMGTKSTRPIYPGTFTRGGTYHAPANTTFDKNQAEYVTVIYGFDSVTITATAEDSTVKNIQFSADGNLVASDLSGGSGSALIPLNYGLVTRIDITVLAGDAVTQKVYTVYAKLLNIDEFYWGIYGPSLDKSKKERWEPKPSAGGSKTVSGLVSGTMKWSITLAPTSTIALTNYNDGKQGFNYNDSGFIVNGTQESELDGVATKDGYNLTKPGTTFYVRTAEGEDVATLGYHIKIDGGETVEASDSYTDITYMGSTNRQIFKTSKPYPFSDTYDWNSSWADGQ